MSFSISSPPFSASNMDAVKIGALALVCLMLLFVLRQWKPEWAPLVRMTAAIVFGTLAMTMVSTVLSFAGDLTGALPEGVWPTMTKALGLALLTEVAAGICRDSGEATLATWVEMAGKLEILILSFPQIEGILEMASEWLSR